MKLKLLLLAGLCAALPASADDSGYLERNGWSWSASSIFPAGTEDDITGLEGAFDGDASTCWHTNYAAESGSPERSNPHWLLIDRGDDQTKFYGISYLPRQINISQCCTGYMVYLSDTDLSSTPATSVDDIISAIGQPTYQGSWQASLDEKQLLFDEPSTARYILFVNVSSYNSSSAACAEFNLISATNPEIKTYNSLKLTPADGSEAHRIAIDGQNLTLSVSETGVRLGNSEITVEYALGELSRMEFEQYDFTDSLYVGPKKDIYAEPDPTPEPDPDQGQSSIDEVEAECTTWVLSRDGSSLIIKGLQPNADATLTAINGITYSGARSDADGTARISLASIPKGVYLLSANNKTIKLHL